MEETIRCGLCERLADKNCATCDRPVCAEHTVTHRVGDRFDYIEVEVCSECAKNPPRNPKAA